MSRLCAPCGSGTVITAPSCADCIWAPSINWLCSDSVGPNQTFSVNILTEASYTLPTGNWEFEVISFDNSGISNVTISQTGDLDIVFNSEFVSMKRYEVKYRIKEADNIRKSTGTISVCKKDLCSDCLGTCDQVTADCAFGFDIKQEVECDGTYTVDTSNWSYDSIIVTQGADQFQSFSSNNVEITFQVQAVVTQSSQVTLELTKGQAKHEVKLDLEFITKCTNVPLGYTCNGCTGELIYINGGTFDATGTHNANLAYTGSGTVINTVEEFDSSVISNPVINAAGVLTYDFISTVPGPVSTIVKVKSTDGQIENFSEFILNVNQCGDCLGACDGTGECVYVGEFEMNDLNCGSSNTLDIKRGTETSYEYFVVSHDDILSNVQISALGILTFDISASVVNFEKDYTINIRKKKGQLFDDGVIIVRLLDLCIGKIVPQGKVCNSCDGTITDAPSSLTLEGGDTTNNLRLD